jgi:hypothetical protein
VFCFINAALERGDKDVFTPDEFTGAAFESV